MLRIRSNQLIPEVLFSSLSVEMQTIENKYECIGFMAFTTARVLCTRSQNSLLPVSVRRVHVVFSTAGFKGGGKPCSKTRETAALQRGILKASHT